MEGGETQEYILQREERHICALHALDAEAVFKSDGSQQRKEESRGDRGRSEGDMTEGAGLEIMKVITCRC